MRRLIVLLGASAGGWIGWWAGAHVGLFAAVFVGSVGTGIGIHFGRRLVSGLGD